MDNRPRKPAGGIEPGMTAQEILAHVSVSHRDLHAYVRPIARRMVKEMVQEIQQGVPAFTQPLQGKFGQVLIAGVERAVRQVVESLERPHADQTAWQDWFRYAGKIEYYEGRTMDSLQSAVRIGTRVAWRHIREAGVVLNLPNEAVFGLADALFRYSDELCTIAIGGYTEAQAKASGTIERRRQQLLKLLISDQPSAPGTLDELAAAAKWTVPDRIAAVALEFRQDQHKLPASKLGQDVLLDLESTEPCLLMAEPERHLDELAKELDGRKATVGPMVPTAEAHRSLAAARRALTLVQRGILPGEDVVHCSEHLTTLALCADEFLLTELTTSALAVFDELTAKQRERLSTTLLAWLSTRGGVNEVATRLDVHPQTIRYRLKHINDLLGERLDDPDERLKLEIALRATQFLNRRDPVAQS